MLADWTFDDYLLIDFEGSLPRSLLLMLDTDMGVFTVNLQRLATLEDITFKLTYRQVINLGSVDGMIHQIAFNKAVTLLSVRVVTATNTGTIVPTQSEGTDHFNVGEYRYRGVRAGFQGFEAWEYKAEFDGKSYKVNADLGDQYVIKMKDVAPLWWWQTVLIWIASLIGVGVLMICCCGCVTCSKDRKKGNLSSSSSTTTTSRPALPPLPPAKPKEKQLPPLLPSKRGEKELNDKLDAKIATHRPPPPPPPVSNTSNSSSSSGRPGSPKTKAPPPPRPFSSSPASSSSSSSGRPSSPKPKAPTPSVKISSLSAATVVGPPKPRFANNSASSSSSSSSTLPRPPENLGKSKTSSLPTPPGKFQRN